MKKQILALIAIISTFAITAKEIDLGALFDYEGQTVPSYISKDNTQDNHITDAGATLGRVLFYDKNLSVDNTIACASCHKQEFAFSDTAIASVGVAGLTGRHSMRLVNTRFAEEQSFFWDKRAATLENQATMPIQDHIEMGFSGTDGNPSISDLINKLDTIPYYAPLFTLAFGDAEITETRVQLALAQFIRSIQSFDSRYDMGRAMVQNDEDNFPNFTMQENMGKRMFTQPPQFNQNGERIGGGFGCAGCHRPPEFDIDPRSFSNGVFGKLENGLKGDGYDVHSTRSPSLRDLFNPQGQLNGPMMHTGEFESISEVLAHYNDITLPEDSLRPYLDRRLQSPSGIQKLNMNDHQMEMIELFLKTLTSSALYSEEKWSSPFSESGELTLLNDPNWKSIEEDNSFISFYPNPVSDYLYLENNEMINSLEITDSNGKTVMIKDNSESIDMSHLSTGIYFIKVSTKNSNSQVYTIIKE